MRGCAGPRPTVATRARVTHALTRRASPRAQELEYEVFGRFARDDRKDTKGFWWTRWCSIDELLETEGIGLGVVRSKIAEWRADEAAAEKAATDAAFARAEARAEARGWRRKRTDRTSIECTCHPYTIRIYLYPDSIRIRVYLCANVRIIVAVDSIILVKRPVL